MSSATILQGSFSGTMQTFSRLSALPLQRENLDAGERQTDKTVTLATESTAPPHLCPLAPFHGLSKKLTTVSPQGDSLLHTPTRLLGLFVQDTNREK